MTHHISLGPFELHRRIGRGGMGEVWEGLHVPQKMPVAVKVLTGRALRQKAHVEAFRNEVRGLAGLDHPSIVTILDYGEMPEGTARLSEGVFASESPYIVMELGRRGSLAKYVDAIGWRELKAVLFTLLDALAHAHAAGIVHRDLKPANVLVGCGTDDDASGIKLTDFGLAHAFDQYDFSSEADAGWGTPQFMAPEQFRCAWRDYGPWTDLYALGVMAFYLCVGRYPYEAADAAGWARAHLLDEPRPFEPRFAVPDGFEAWIERLMQRRPSHRFQLAADAGWALQTLGDPPFDEVSHSTISMIPLAGERSVWMTDDRLRPIGDTAKWGAQAGSLDTMLDKPPTTQLLDQVVDLRSTSTVRNASAPIPPPSMHSNAPPLPYTWHRPMVSSASPKLLGAGLGLFGLRTLPMVGREQERDLLWERLREVREDRTAHAVVIRGAAGTGKSRLASWMCRRAHELGAARVLKSVFSPISGPGDGLARMVAQHLRAGGMNAQETLLRLATVLQRYGVRDEESVAEMMRFVMPLAGTSPEFRTLSVRTRVRGPNARYTFLANHLARLAEDRPVILWFDDVQWGADALAFARFLLERQHLTPQPILVLMTVRDEALVERSVETELTREIVQNRRSTVMAVEPLEEAHSAMLVRQLLYLSPTLANDVQRRSRGNPLFAVQLVGDWVAGGKLQFGRDGFELKPGTAAVIPSDLQSMWSERHAMLLRRRPPADEVALEVAAALGSPVDVDEWQAACAKYGVALDDGLTRDLLEAGLMVRTEVGLELCHGMFRESLERASERGSRRVAIHEACLQMLDERYPDRPYPFAERAAQHLLASNRMADAIEPLLSAAQARVDRSEFEFALSHLDRRERILDALGRDEHCEERSVGRVARAEVYLWQGRYMEVERLAERAAVDARRGGWFEVLARALSVGAQALLHRGEMDLAERGFERALAEFRSTHNDIGSGQCLQGLGRVHHARGDLVAAESHYIAARDRLVRAKHVLGEAQCLNAMGDLERDRANWEKALEYAQHAEALFESLGNGIGIADCVNDIAEMHRLCGDFDEAKRGCLEALRRYEALGSEHAMHVRVNLALTLAAAGQTAEARQLLDRIRVRLEQSEQTSLLATVNLLLMPVLLDLGEYDLAWQRFRAVRRERTGFDLHVRDVLAAAVRSEEALNALGRQEEADVLQKFIDDTLRFR